MSSSYDPLTIPPYARYQDGEQSFEESNFPKYVSGFLNEANRYSQATRPSNIGHINEIFQEYMTTVDTPTYHSWVEHFYKNHNGQAKIDTATATMAEKVGQMQEAILQIDEEIIREWICDLILKKSYKGFFIEKRILERICLRYDLQWDLSTPDEESKGIDGHLIGDGQWWPISIKPRSYKSKIREQEGISVPVIYYSEQEDGTIRVYPEEIRDAGIIESQSSLDKFSP